MTSEEIQWCFKRLARLVKATQQKSGDGTTWDFTFPNGETHRYIFRNIKSFEQVKDNVIDLLIWLWSAKDWLRKRAATKGRNHNFVERVVNNDPHLRLCADLANGLKHGGLEHSRTDKFPRLGEVRFTAPQSVFRSITFRAFEVDMDINDPRGVEFQMPIIDKAGNEIGDAFEYAAAAIRRLETLRDEIELAT